MPALVLYFSFASRGREGPHFDGSREGGKKKKGGRMVGGSPSLSASSPIWKEEATCRSPAVSSVRGVSQKKKKEKEKGREMST